MQLTLDTFTIHGMAYYEAAKILWKKSPKNLHGMAYYEAAKILWKKIT